MYRTGISSLASYWAKPKVGPVVVVSTPEAKEYIRRRFWYQHPMFVRGWQSKASELQGIF
jgi:hypothetical protein